jgi:hypothetical protein
VFSPTLREVPVGPDFKQVVPPVSDIPQGTPIEESVAGKRSYLDVLRQIHAHLKPELYIEIGIHQGTSLALAQADAIGIDPLPKLGAKVLPERFKIEKCTSDEYFQRLGPDADIQPDFAFIDGMHHFEFALRDFMYIERISGLATLVAIDDIFPVHPAQAERERRTRVWTGDVWKLVTCLEKYRPDLQLISLDTAPAGMLLIAGLNSDSHVLWDEYDTILADYLGATVPPVSVLVRWKAVAPDDAQLAALFSALHLARVNCASRALIQSSLKAIRAGI